MENILLQLENEYLEDLKINEKYQIAWQHHPKLYNNMFMQGEGGRRVLQLPSIFRRIQQLISDKIIPYNFTILDVFCGDGLFLQSIKEKFPSCNAYGVDVYKTEWKAYKTVTDSGVKMFRIPVQKLINAPIDNPPDLIMMMNSYRAFKEGRDNKELESNSFSIPISIEKIDKWIQTNSKYFIWEETVR